MNIEPFQATFPNFEMIASPDAFCEDAKNAFREYQDNGLFNNSPQEALYVYQILTATGRQHIGLMCLNQVQDYFDGKIKKHENTLSEKEQQQMQLFLRWNAVLKPVLLAYSPVQIINNWLEAFILKHQPMFSTFFEKDNQTHTVWAVTDKSEIHHLQTLFSEHIFSSYIADGHHRTTTIALLHERQNEQNPDLVFNHLFCAYFSADQLDILDYNRVVVGLKDITPVQFVVKLSKIFDLEVLENPRRPVCKHEIVMYVMREWYSLRWKKDVLEHHQRGSVILDANLLNELVLHDILGIKDVRNDARVMYVEGSKGLDGVRKSTKPSKSRIGFMMFPVAFEDMVQMADSGESLPPKSTYFEPRMRSGLMVNLLKTQTISPTGDLSV